MRNPFAHKQIRCEHCEFEFFFTEFGSAVKIVCPACGEEIMLHPVSGTPAPELTAPLPQVAEDKPVICSVETCPLLSDDEPQSTVAQEIGLRLREKNRRRHTIMAWTVTLQVCVLIGTGLFITKTVLTMADKTTSPPVVVQAVPVPVKPSIDLLPQNYGTVPPPEYITPLPVVPEAPMAQQVVPIPEPPIVNVEPDYIVSPFEIAQDIFSTPPIEPPTITPDLVMEIPTPTTIEETPPIPPQVEPITLETAENLLTSAKTTLATNPEDSVAKAIRAAKIYEQLEHPLPDSMYWTLGNAFASLSWGEPLLEESSAVETMVLSPDGRCLLAQLRDRTVWLWDLQSTEKPYCLDSGTTEYVKFVFTPDLRWIIGGQKGGVIRIWDMSLNSPENTLITFTERVHGLQDLQISPDGQWLAAFGNTAKGVAVVENQTTDSEIQQVSYWRPDRANDLSSYPVLVWNLRQMGAGVVPIAMPIPPSPQPVQVIRFSPNSDRLAIGRQDAIAMVYELTTRGVNEEPFVLRGHQLAITQIAFAPSGLWMATGSQDNTVRLWSLTNSKYSPESAALYGHLGWISALMVDPTGEYLLSGSYDRTIRIWNIQRNRIATALSKAPIVLEADLGVLESLAITRDGDKMIARGNEGSLGIYHLPSLLTADSEYYHRAVTFRNSKLSISKCLLTSDDQVLIFSYEHLLNPANSGIRLWALQPQPFVR
jgi:WD40 repeat protein